jgi:hypothetical protein
MSSECKCHVEGAFCFYCEVYAPVVAENERLKMRLSDWTRQIFTLEDRALKAEADSYHMRGGYETLIEALREIDTHIRATSEPIPHIVATLKRVLPEYAEESGDPFADEEVSVQCTNT